MITKEEMATKPDNELNGILHYLKHYSSQAGSQVVSAFVPDYCNTPNDIMPIAFANFVGVTPMVARWKAYKIGIVGVEFEFEDKNPLRAIACCLILVLQAQK